MARIYSWQLTDTKFAYITGVDDNEPFVGNRLNTENYDKVVTKVDAMGATEYSSNFQKLCILCERYGLDPTKDKTISYAAFYDTASLSSDFMVVLAGRDGKDGAQGPKGDKGDPGEPGAKPDTPIPYISVTAYCSTGQDDTPPTTPQNVKITWNADLGTYEFDDTDDRWYLYDNEANENDGDNSMKSIIWQSSAIYNDKGIVSPWTKPIRITGENGEPGSDGNNLEFIYRLWESPLPPDRPTESEDVNKFVPEGWSNRPSGINESNPYEYMCQRSKDENDKWKDWEGPFIWSRWGEDGKDGDGVEYVYYTTNGTVPGFRCPDTINSDAYQEIEYRPIAQLPNGPNDTMIDVETEGKEKWFDNPQQIDSEENRAQWVLTRRRRVVEGESKAKWGEFTGPVLWSMYGEKGDQGVEGLNVYERKMYQSSTGSTAPEYDREDFDPGSLWSTSIPEKGTGEVIWCIEAYIKLDLSGEEKKQILCWYDGSTDEIDNDVPHWSVPYIIEGRDGTDAAHTQEEIFRAYAIDETPQKPSENENKDYFCPTGWDSHPTGITSATPVCYMCYRERALKEHWGEWGEWKGPFLYTQLGSQGPAGVDGTDGRDGNGVEFCYTLTSTYDAPNCYIPTEDITSGDIYLDDYCPCIGDTGLRWADEPQGVDEGNPYEWVISRTKIYDEKNGVFKWSDFSDPGVYAKWGFNGMDGKDIEYVYCLTKTYEKPGVVSYDNTSSAAQSPEFYPEISFSGTSSNVSGNTVSGKKYWMDNAKDVTIDWPYQWEIIRKRIATVNKTNPNLYDYTWEAYTNDNVILHSKWGRDGDQGRQGASGVAGVNYEMRFIWARNDEDDNVILSVPEIKSGNFTGKFIEVGLENGEWDSYWTGTIHPGLSTSLNKTRNLNKTYFPLYTNARDTDKDYPYIFFVQSRIATERSETKEYNPNNGEYEVVGWEDIEVLENGEWEDPIRLTGKQGIQGPEGKRGPILYSAGVYGMGKKYYTDGVKKPYVLDPADNEYYYLEKGNYTAGSDCGDGTGADTMGMDYWYMDPDGTTGSMSKNPSSSVANGQDYWVKMEQFDVILANVGIFKSALVGSGVFYGEWFYSQNGMKDGSNTIYTNYEEFDPNTTINKGPTIVWGSNNAFWPSLALNLKDGSGWFANRKIVWDSWGNMNCDVTGNFNGSGNGSLAGGAITWDYNGLYIHKDTTFDEDVSLTWSNISDREKIEEIIEKAQDTADAAGARMDNWVADGYITKLELQGIKDEKVFIEADKNDIDNKCTKYNIPANNSARSAYTSAYNTYLSALTTIINGFTGTVERVSVGNLESSQENYYLKRTAILEAIVTVEQSYMSNAANEAMEAAKEYSDGNTDALKKYAEDYVNDKVPTEEYITTITQNAITTDWLNARNLTAAYVTTAALSAHTATIGSIAAENLDVDNLYVKKLNTKGEGVYGSGTISIEDNEMKVFNSSSDIEIVRITGEKLPPIEDLPSQSNGGFSHFSDYPFSNEGFTNILRSGQTGYTTMKLGSFTIPDDGYQYIISGLLATTANLYLETTNFTSAMKASITASCAIVITTASTISTSTGETTTPYSIFSNTAGSGGNASCTVSINFSREVYENYNNPGKYNVFLRYRFLYYPSHFSSMAGITASLYIGVSALSLTPNLNRCEISSQGFRYLVDKTKYAEFTTDGNFIIKNGGTMLKLSNTKMYMSFGEYADGNTYEIKPVYKQWRTVGADITGYVLTLGGLS